MAYNYDDVKVLTAQVDTISKRVAADAYASQVEKFPLLGLVPVSTIPETQTSFEYTPETRLWVAGDASPATCRSEPNRVETARGVPIKGFNTLHELGYEICALDCRDKSLEEIIIEKEKAVSLGLLRVLSNRFWKGNPQMLQYGITNHPSITEIASPADGTGSVSEWSAKTDNQVMKEMRSAMKNMIKPVVFMSEEAYEESLGNAAESNTNTGGNRLRADIIADLLARQESINFDGRIRFTDELDNHADFSNENVCVIYDEGAVEIQASGLIWKGATHGAKVVDVNRMINTSGLVINYYESVKIIVGI